jgi:hypothetical protein
MSFSTPYQLIEGDCLKQMAKLPVGSVDMVLTDLPYGTTTNVWDSVIPLDLLWAEWKRICKPGAPIVLFTQMPFTASVASSNLKQLKSELIWSKRQGTGFLNAKKYPLKSHENILVFCDRTPPYHPQMSYGSMPYTTGGGRSSTTFTFRSGHLHHRRSDRSTPWSAEPKATHCLPRNQRCDHLCQSREGNHPFDEPGRGNQI